MSSTGSTLRRSLIAGTATLAMVSGAACAAPGTPLQTLCGQYEAMPIQDGRYRVQNNVWGAPTPQCIQVTTTGFTITSAGHNNPTDGRPASYPSIYLGCHYNNCTTGSGLPRTFSSVPAINSAVTITDPGTGEWNAAYDLWLDPTPRTNGQNTGAEIMIWVNHRGRPQPIGSRVGSVSIAGATWAVWYGNVGWNVVSYVREPTAASFSGDLKAFVDDAANRGHVQRSWYLTSVQFGFEPWVGGTGLGVTSFSASAG